jgi:hypothetical protein
MGGVTPFAEQYPLAPDGKNALAFVLQIHLPDLNTFFCNKSRCLKMVPLGFFYEGGRKVFGDQPPRSRRMASAVLR